MDPDSDKFHIGFELLRYIQANLPYAKAVICGGYVRDTDNGKQWRDIDLYCDPVHWADIIHLCTSDKDAAEKVCFFAGNEVEYTHQSIEAHVELVSTLPFLPGVLIDFVKMKDGVEISVLDIIDKFNIGFNQIGLSLYEDKATVTKSFAYQRDSTNKTISILRTSWGVEHTAKNVDKLLAKYGPRPVIINGAEINLDAFRDGQYTIGDSNDGDNF